MGLAYIASYVKRHGYSVRIVDATWNPKGVVEQVRSYHPYFVGIYTSTLMLPAAMITAKLLSSLGYPIVAGGPHATMRPQDCAWADIVVQGEGEKAMLDILSGYSKGHDIIRGEPLDLEDLPSLEWFDMKKYGDAWHYHDSFNPGARGTNIIASRGCPYSCSYCQPTLNKTFGKGLRAHNPAKIVQYIQEMRNKYHINGFFFHDDTFTANHRWLERFLYHLGYDNVIPWSCNSRVNTVNYTLLKDMYKNGCKSIHFGIESGSQRVLDEIYNKKITLYQVKEAVHSAHDVGIHAGGFFMIGAPGETREEIQQTVDLACSLPLSEASFSIFVPLPGTHIYDKLVNDGVMLSHNFLDYDYYNNQPYQGAIPLQELRSIQRKALIRFYLGHPGYMMTQIRSTRGIKKLFRKVGRLK